MQASGLAGFTPFTCSSAFGGNPVYLFTLLLAPPVPQQSRWGRQHPLVCSFGSPHSHLEARNRWWLWYFLFTNMAEVFSLYSRISGKESACKQEPQETQVLSLGWEDPLATHSSILARRIPMAGYSPRGRKASDKTERLSRAQKPNSSRSVPLKYDS